MRGNLHFMINSLHEVPDFFVKLICSNRDYLITMKVEIVIAFFVALAFSPRVVSIKLNCIPPVFPVLQWYEDNKVRSTPLGNTNSGLRNEHRKLSMFYELNVSMQKLSLVFRLAESGNLFP